MEWKGDFAIEQREKRKVRRTAEQQGGDLGKDEKVNFEVGGDRGDLLSERRREECGQTQRLANSRKGKGRGSKKLRKSWGKGTWSGQVDSGERLMSTLVTEKWGCGYNKVWEGGRVWGRSESWTYSLPMKDACIGLGNWAGGGRWPVCVLSPG